QGRAASGGKPPLTTGVRRKKAATMSEWVALLTGFLIEGWISVAHPRVRRYGAWWMRPAPCASSSAGIPRF
ncbi:MAG: hypothetical protein ACRESZ_20390, partial [Methylococcales bacterium]